MRVRDVMDGASAASPWRKQNLALKQGFTNDELVFSFALREL